MAFAHFHCKTPSQGAYETAQPQGPMAGLSVSTLLFRYYVGIGWFSKPNGAVMFHMYILTLHSV